MRPNVGTELVCRLVEGAAIEGEVVAELARGGDRRRTVLNPEGRFSGLLPGSWRLTVHHGDRLVERHQLELKAGEVATFAIQVH